MQTDALETAKRYSFVVTDLISIDSILAEGDFAGKEFADRTLYVEAWYTDSGFGKHSGLTLAEGTWPQVGDAEDSPRPWPSVRTWRRHCFLGPMM